MENKKEYPMTQAGFDQLHVDLEELKTVKRPEVVEKIKVARSFGDLSENSEYDAAKDEQGFVEKEITKIEEMIRHAVIIEDTGDNNTVSLGITITFKGNSDGDDVSYRSDGSAEADPFEGKISNGSPMSQSLLGDKRKDEVKVALPTGGEMKVKIVKID